MCYSKNMDNKWYFQPWVQHLITTVALTLGAMALFLFSWGVSQRVF